MASLPSHVALETSSLPLEAGTTGGPPCPLVIYVGSGVLNSSPHAFGVNALSTEPFL